MKEQQKYHSEMYEKVEKASKKRKQYTVINHDTMYQTLLITVPQQAIVYAVVFVIVAAVVFVVVESFICRGDNSFLSRQLSGQGINYQLSYLPSN